MTKRWSGVLLCLLITRPAWCVKPTLYDKLVQTEVNAIKEDSQDALTRAGGWLVLAMGAMAGHLYYGRKANKADELAQAYRDTSSNNYGIVYLTKSRWPGRPPPPPIDPPIFERPSIVDFGPARNMERRASRWRGKAQILYGGSMVMFVLAGMNLNQHMKFEADAEHLALSIQKRF